MKRPTSNWADLILSRSKEFALHSFFQAQFSSLAMPEESFIAELCDGAEHKMPPISVSSQNWHQKILVQTPHRSKTFTSVTPM